jgi:hypothetical protein
MHSLTSIVSQLSVYSDAEAASRSFVELSGATTYIN